MDFTVYDSSTGEILRSGECIVSDFPLQQQGPSEVVIEGRFNRRLFYVVDGDLVDRPPLIDYAAASIAGDGVDELVISGVPEGTEVWLDGQPMGTVEDGELRYASIEPREHYLRIVPPFPWQDHDVVVTVE